MLAFGIHNIAIIKPAVDIFDPKTIRASMGALFHINFSYFETFEIYKNLFEQNNIYCFLTDATRSIKRTKFQEPCSLVFGSESAGLNSNYNNIGTSVIIPQTKFVDSLNLSIATAIAMSHIYNQ